MTKIKASSVKEMAEETNKQAVLNMFFTIKQVTLPVLKGSS